MTAVSDGYNIWTVERKPVSVHLRESVAAQIRAAASAPQESRAGLERGGILWGRVRDAGEDYYLISIEYAEHLSCDHTHGEGWVPSEKERKYLRKRLKQGYGDLQCVGYWRTHQRPGLYLDTRDLDLMATLFSQPWCVALCVRPPATAGFFLWENGDIHRTSSYREFELPEAEQPEMAPAPEPESRRRLRTQNWRRWAAAGAMAAVLAIAPFLLSSSSTSTPFNMLSMHAETGPGTVKLRWNPESKVLENASGAVIWIADGSEESKLELTSAQLRAGVLEYKPAGPDLNFRMEIGPFTESLRVSNVRPGDGVEYASARSRDEVDVAPQRETARSERRRRIQEAENAPVPATTEGPPAPAPA